MKRRPLKSQVVQVRLTAAEKKELELEAINADMSLSELCRIKLVGILLPDLRERLQRAKMEAIQNAPNLDRGVTIVQEFGGKFIEKTKAEPDE